MSSSSSTTTTEEWDLELLDGFRFNPRKEQMVKILKKKIQGKTSQATHIMPAESCDQTWEPGSQSISLFRRFLREMMQGQFIPEINVLKSEPWDLPGLLFPDSPYQPREWFAFCRPDHINNNSGRCHRATEQGFWKSTGQPREIKSLEHSFTCKMRTLTFHIGRVSNSEKTDWVMQEYFPTEAKLGSPHFVLVRVKNKSDRKKLKDTPIASNSENQPAADTTNHVIPAPKEHLAHNEPEDVQFGNGDDHDVGEPGGCVLSDFDVDDVIQEPPDQDTPFPTPEPPELGNVTDVYNEWSNCKDQAAAVVTPESQDYRSTTLQSPANMELGIVLQANGTIDHRNAMQSPFRDIYYSVTHKNDTSTCDEREPHSTSASNFEIEHASGSFRELPAQPVKDLDRLQVNVTQQPPAYTKLGDVSNNDDKQVSNMAFNFVQQASYERILQVYSPREENLELLFHPPQPEDYAVQPLMETDVGDVLHDNYIEWNDLQFPIW